MRSICSGVLRMITAFESRALKLFLHAEGGEHRPDPIADLVRSWEPVNPAKQGALLVVAHERLGLLVIGAEPPANHLGLVVIAELKPRAADVTHALVLRGIELHVKDVAFLHAHTATAEAPDDLLVWNIDHDRGGELTSELTKFRIERLALSDRPGESIEDEPVGGLIAGHSLGDQADHHLIGHQVTLVHVLLGLRPKLGAVAHASTQNVAGGVVRQPEVHLQPLALRPLSGAGRAQEHEIELGHGVYPGTPPMPGGPRVYAGFLDGHIGPESLEIRARTSDLAAPGS